MRVCVAEEVCPRTSPPDATKVFALRVAGGRNHEGLPAREAGNGFQALAAARRFTQLPGGLRSTRAGKLLFSAARQRLPDTTANGLP